MGFRFRKGFSLGGLRLNVSQGVSAPAGGCQAFDSAWPLTADATSRSGYQESASTTWSTSLGPS